MGKLQFVNDNKLGSHAVMVPSSGHVELDMPGRRVRVFPHEGITEGFDEHEKQPKAYSEGARPNSENGYSNPYGSSITGLGSHEGTFTEL